MDYFRRLDLERDVIRTVVGHIRHIFYQEGILGVHRALSQYNYITRARIMRQLQLAYSVQISIELSVRQIIKEREMENVKQTNGAEPTSQIV